MDTLIELPRVQLARIEEIVRPNGLPDGGGGGPLSDAEVEQRCRDAATAIGQSWEGLQARLDQGCERRFFVFALKFGERPALNAAPSARPLPASSQGSKKGRDKPAF